MSTTSAPSAYLHGSRMHNIVHNMANDLGVSNHLTARAGVYQYVRRVPDDVRAAFPFGRIQKSLGTRDQRQARATALDLDRQWDQRFNEARQRSGVVVDGFRPAVVSTMDWTWPDWEALAAWFGASLAEEDWRERLGSVKGGAFGAEPDLTHLPWRSDPIVKEHIARRRRLEESAVATYAAERITFVQSYVRRLGIAISRTDPGFERFIAACLKAELAYLDLFQLREARRGGLDHSHPDTIDGPWRTAPPLARRTATTTPASETTPAAIASADNAASSAAQPSGKTLKDCRAKWIENRVKARKQVRDDYLRDMDATISLFEAHAGLSDIGTMRRKHVLAFRDHLESTRDYKTATVNKKVGYVSALLRTALKAGWTEVALGENIFLEVPEDEGTREPYQAQDLKRIFAHPIFTAGHRFTRAKACGELQFWLPLIACLHGMISSEILQLGPDTVLPHPDAPEVLCFEVTNAGDRRVKTLARRRWVPIRRELLALGLTDLVAAAKEEKQRWLWSNMNMQDGDVTRVSGYFSSFWAALSRSELKVGSGLSLYSFRHAFQDALAKAGHGDEVKKALMGHSESGMTSRYGTKSRPREVNIQEIDAAVQGLHWQFLKTILTTCEPPS